MWMLTLEALSPALLLFKFSLVCTDLKGEKVIEHNTIIDRGRYIGYFPLVQSSHPLQHGEDLDLLWCLDWLDKLQSNTKSCLNKICRPVFWHAPPQHPVPCRNTLSRSPISCSNMTVYFLLDFFFSFAFSLQFAWKLLWMSLVLQEESQYTPNFLMISIIY